MKALLAAVEVWKVCCPHVLVSQQPQAGVSAVNAAEQRPTDARDAGGSEPLHGHCERP